MTFWELIRAFLRFWPVVLIGAVCTGAIGAAVVADKGVAFTRTELIFLAPTSPLYPNALRTQSEDIIITAGAVARQISGPGQVAKFASPEVSLVGLGVRDGWSIRLPDTGGQWATNFATQRLILDIVAPTPEGVVVRQSELIDRVGEQLAAMQREAGVYEAAMITVIPAPESTMVYQVGGSRPRALGMTAVLGIGVTAAVVILLERRRQRAVAEASRMPHTRRAMGELLPT
ncbi:hypothetical protein N3K63_01675 [Microbacterium sp. W1N]|uniref:hypothetical protein n=1 Tax=Microbacterium festucae TaxID=2977531 RepID=UPI0021C2009E|nr:hypothetical protein [Microbacterium festucae]MCT9818989.1 hypothetical protein [Microbacterium festucae]